MQNKTFSGRLAFKGAGGGRFEAVFATLNVIDLDNDVTLPGAFGSQAVHVEQWNHDRKAPPAGKGHIFERGNEAIVAGEFFLDTLAGRELYAVVSKTADFQEWSYTFRVEKSRPGTFQGKSVRFLEKLDVIGVGPVDRGAGITRTLNVKGLKLRPADAQWEIDRIAGEVAAMHAARLPKKLRRVDVLLKQLRDEFPEMSDAYILARYIGIRAAMEQRAYVAQEGQAYSPSWGRARQSVTRWLLSEVR